MIIVEERRNLGTNQGVKCAKGTHCHRGHKKWDKYASLSNAPLSLVCSVSSIHPTTALLDEPLDFSLRQIKKKEAGQGLF